MMSGLNAGDHEQQEEEVLALEAIFAEAFTSFGNGRAEVSIPSAGASNKVTVGIHLPDDYPSASPPVLEIHGGSVSAEQQAEAIQHLHELFQPGKGTFTSAGNVVLYEFLAWLQEQEHYWEVEEPPDEAVGPALPEGLSEDRELHDSGHIEAEGSDAKLAQIWSIIRSGAAFTEKKSVFQAHLAPVSTLETVERVMATLLMNGKIQRATHNIMAYRIAVPDKGTHLQDYDDDGESAAGGRLLKLLALVGAENVVVVVSRWYGGVLLGPARFTHINNAARQLLDNCGYVISKQSKTSKRR